MFNGDGLLVVEIPDLENPSFTFALLDGTNLGLTVGTDLDTDDDGTPDADLTGLTPLDAIGIADGSGDVGLLYGTDLGGVDFSTTDEFELVFRDSVTLLPYGVNEPQLEVLAVDGTVFSTADFTGSLPATSFGSVNPTFIPEPATAGLLAFAGLGLLRRRRA
jgi:hypothetical protein